MKYEIEILLCEGEKKPSHWEKFTYETEAENATVAMALDGINAGLTDSRVEWECSCLQKKCGACAMVINGTPALACDTMLCELKSPIRLSPLKKFPVVKDLRVDRSRMMENLCSMEQWLSKETGVNNDNQGPAYEASRCLQCGICLELCPNFYAEGSFFGMSSAMPASRVIATQGRENGAISQNYKKHVFNGCGKSLACRDRCPAGIDIDSLLVRSNAAAVWKKGLK